MLELANERGGFNALARSLGWKNGSYFSQINIGHRTFSETSAREIEAKLGLGNGYFDSAKPVPLDGRLLSSVISEVLEALKPVLSELVTQIYKSSLQSGQVDRRDVRIRVAKILP